MRRQLVPSVISMVDLHRDPGHRVPAGRPRHRPARVQGQGRRLDHRAQRQGGGLVAHRPGVHDQEGRPPSRVLPVAPVGGGRRLGQHGGGLRPDPQQRIEPRSDEPRLPEGGCAARQGLPEAQRPLAEHEGARRRGDRVRLGARSRTSRSPTPGCKHRVSPTNGGSPSPRSTSSSTTTPRAAHSASSARRR